MLADDSGGVPEPATGATWDRLAGQYDDGRRTDPVYQSCIDQVAVPFALESVELCLDAGCGTGLSTTALLKHVGVVVGVDYSLHSLRCLQQKHGSDRVLPVLADLAKLPFRDGVFDGVVCANTLQHFRPGAQQQAVIVELRRVGRSNALIAVSVHHYSHDKQKGGWIKEGTPGQAGVDYIYRFTLRDLRRLIPDASIRAAGFYGILTLPLLARALQNLLSALFGRLGARLGRGHMLVAITRIRRPVVERNDAG